MKKFDSILKENKNIEEFKVFDVDSEWNSFLTKVGDSQPLPVDKISEVKKSPLSLIFKKPAISIISIAASLILILGVIFTFKSAEPYRNTLITADNTEKINMIDGSKIELNQNSKLEFPVTLDKVTERKVILTGSATFDVNRNENLPFKVYYGDILVEVLGTQFAISKKDGLTIVQNISGSVAVSEVLNKSNKRILNQGETLLFRYGSFFMPQDTVQSLEEEHDDHEFESDIDNEGKTIYKSKKKKDKKESEKGSTFKLDNVVKNYLLKFHKKKLKVERGTKFDKNATVKIDINKTYQEILQDLKKQGLIDFKAGECDDCFIITTPTKK